MSHTHFKTGRLNILKDFLLKGALMCKLDLKSAYFSIHLHPSPRKSVRFLWIENIYQFLCLFFGLGSTPLVFAKIMKIPISLLRKLNLIIAIYLDNMVLLGQTRKGILKALDSLIFSLKNVGKSLSSKQYIK